MSEYRGDGWTVIVDGELFRRTHDHGDWLARTDDKPLPDGHRYLPIDKNGDRFAVCKNIEQMVFNGQYIDMVKANLLEYVEPYT